MREGWVGGVVQETGKENMFVFGMDAEDVPVWREGKRKEWKDYDPRFVKALDLIKSGTFGEVDYFKVRTHAWPGLHRAQLPCISLTGVRCSECARTLCMEKSQAPQPRAQPN